MTFVGKAVPTVMTLKDQVGIFESLTFTKKGRSNPFGIGTFVSVYAYDRSQV